MPVKSVTVALPPRINMVETMMFVARPKHKNTRWASLPHLARMISRKLEMQVEECVVKTTRGEDVRVSVGSVLLDLGSDHCKQQNLSRRWNQCETEGGEERIFT
jgi:hypothetical protein